MLLCGEAACTASWHLMALVQQRTPINGSAQTSAYPCAGSIRFHVTVIDCSTIKWFESQAISLWGFWEICRGNRRDACSSSGPWFFTLKMPPLSKASNSSSGSTAPRGMDQPQFRHLRAEIRCWPGRIPSCRAGAAQRPFQHLPTH
jgi:hypothetical protein